MHKQISNSLPQFLRLVFVTASTLVAASSFSLCRAQQIDVPAQSVIRDNDRIVFVGDSNTGRGMNGGDRGWINLIGEGLAQTHPNGKPTVVALGGSGQGTSSWVGMEKESRTKNFGLDVPNVDVKTELDKPADVVVIMLGTNDVLSPYISNDADGFDRWEQDYKSLIVALRERVKPRIIAAATIIPQTEAIDSTKNIAIAEMNSRLAKLAEAENVLLLPTNEALWSALKTGRTLVPNFHILEDTVHVDNTGHFALAKGMLQGFGEPVAEKFIDTKYLAPVWKTLAPELPNLSYTLEALPTAGLTDDKESFKLHYCWTTALPGETPAKTAPKISLTLPAGWSTPTTTSTKSSGSFVVSGQADRLHNVFKLAAKDGDISRETIIDIPPPWILGRAQAPRDGWKADFSSFDPVAGHFAADDALIAGKGWGQPVEIAPNAPMSWGRWTPSIDYVGGSAPGSVDMSAVSYFGTFDAAYGMRWIYSDRDRTIQWKLGSQAFSGTDSYISVWLNGNSILAGQIGASTNKVMDAQLKKGWNPLVFKSNHLRWQWQFSFDLVETPEDDLSGLRFSIAPRP